MEGPPLLLLHEDQQLGRSCGCGDLYEERKGIGHAVRVLVGVPTFEEFAARYLKEDTDDLAWTTLTDRKRELRAEGRVVKFFGGMRLDEITSPLVREFWNEHVLGENRGPGAGKNDIKALSAVPRYAIDLEIIETNPVDPFQRTLGRKRRSQRGRQQSDPERHTRPIEDPAHIKKLVTAARKEDQEAHVLTLLLLDAGLRLGEALGLRWGHIVWGEDDDDPSRALRIEESRPRGGSPGPTKSGRIRRVALSRRLRGLLGSVYRSRFAPSDEVHVLPDIDPANFRNREWRRILKRAKIGHIRMKDLRDTFASQLLTAGVPLGYVSKQLGHADVAVTARHCARWAGGDEYREPVRLEEGEVPADLLAQLEEREKSQQSLNTSDSAELPESEELENPSVVALLAGLRGGADGIRTRDLRRDRPAF